MESLVFTHLTGFSNTAILPHFNKLQKLSQKAEFSKPLSGAHSKPVSLGPYSLLLEGNDDPQGWYQRVWNPDRHSLP
jgi:hypothetical protein